MHRVHSFSVLVGSAGSPLPPGASVVTLRLLSYRGFFGWSSAALPVLPASGLLGGVDAGVDAGAQHAASVQPGHAFAKAPTNVGSKAGGAAASGAAGTTCPPFPMGQRPRPARYELTALSLSRQATNPWGCRSFVKLPLMLPLAALASGEALWTAGAERGARELLEGHALWLQRARDGRGAAGREACGRAADASGGLPEDTSADESNRQVS